MKTQLQPKGVGLLVQIVALAFVLAWSGCMSVRLIADYDEEIDKGITAFQRKVETFLTGLERDAGRPAAIYEVNTKFYDSARVDLSALRVRAKAHAKNERTAKQIDLLRGSIDNLDKLHQSHSKGIPRDEIAPLRDAFNISCTAILKLEIAKKRGESGTKNQ